MRPHSTYELRFRGNFAIDISTTMIKNLYGFNSSQDVIHLQTKYSLFGRVANIVFSTEIESGFDKETMKEAINKVIERNDCLRLMFVKQGKDVLQYFEDRRTINNFPEVSFRFNGDKLRFIKRFRKNALKIYKGEVLKVVFATELSGKQSIYFKISHYVADTYGIGVIVSDLFKVYDALKNKTELPDAPGSFESVLQKDLAYKANDDLRQKDEIFFKDYYGVRHTEHPTYCGLHGYYSDIWMKLKAKGQFWLPYFFVRCSTEGYRFTIPAAIGSKVKNWCSDNAIPLSSFYFTTCNIAATLVNGKEKRLAPLMLLDCRGTRSERTAGGTKVQSMSVYSTIDYTKSFAENISEAFNDQNELYKHTRLSYLEVEALQHKLWNYPLTGQVINYAFSFIPFEMPDGIRFQVHSNGKGALPAYVGLMVSSKTDEIDVVYDVQTILFTGAQLAEFQNTYVHVIETVLNAPNKTLDEIL